jgi:hypothetical protein
MFDFLLSVGGEGKRLLDFGPGDGWPSLIFAPFAREVVGVEGSQNRRRVCEENAARMGIANAEFVYAGPGGRIRMMYEDLDRYRGGREREIALEKKGERESLMVIYARNAREETARMFSLSISLPHQKLPRLLGQAGQPIRFRALRESHMEAIRPYISGARTCELTHPSGTTYRAMLEEA